VVLGPAAGVAMCRPTGLVMMHDGSGVFISDPCQGAAR
jgi:hypothetical protein